MEEKTITLILAGLIIRLSKVRKQDVMASRVKKCLPISILSNLRSRKSIPEDRKEKEHPRSNVSGGCSDVDVLIGRSRIVAGDVT